MTQQSMLGAVAPKRWNRAQQAWSLITTSPDRPCVHESRIQGGARRCDRRQTGPNTPRVTASVASSGTGLYLLSPDPSTNLAAALRVISRRLSAVRQENSVCPLIVRHRWTRGRPRAWAGTAVSADRTTRWAADAVGKYEVNRLAGLTRRGSSRRRRLQQIIVCGTSHLTLALCAEPWRSADLRRDYYTAPHESALPLAHTGGREFRGIPGTITRFQQQELLGLASSGPQIQAIPEAPSVPMLMRTDHRLTATPAARRP